MANGIYPIRAIAKLTGITAENIRAWERRYGAVVPQRSKGGRLFSEEDLARLKLLKKAVDNGHSIGRIATLDDDLLMQLPLKSDNQVAAASIKDSSHQQEIETVLALIGDYEILEASRTLGKLASFLSPRSFIHEIVTPLMRRVGSAWGEGDFSIAQEHLASAMVRDVMGTLIRIYQRNTPQSRLLFATPAQEYHELGILSAALLAANGGLGIVYLGANMPHDDLIKAARKTKPRAVVLGLINRPSREKVNKSYFKKVRQALPEKIDLLAGGHFEETFRLGLLAMDVPTFDSLEAFETKIRHYGAVV